MISVLYCLVKIQQYNQRHIATALIIAICHYLLVDAIPCYFIYDLFNPFETKHSSCLLASQCMNQALSLLYLLLQSHPLNHVLPNANHAI